MIDTIDPKGEEYWAATTKLIVGLRGIYPEWDLMNVVESARQVRASVGRSPLSADEVEVFADIWEILEARKAKAAA
jgi:hypothetical protein